MLLYLRTSKGDINTQNTGDRANEIVDGSHWHYPWAFPASLEPYEIRRSQSEFLNHDTGDLLLAVKTIGKDNGTSEMYIGIDGSFYQRYGQRVLDVSDINSIVASAVAKLASTCPFPVGTSFLVCANESDRAILGENTGLDITNKMAQSLQNQYSGTTWTSYSTGIKVIATSLYLYGVERTA